MDFKFWFNNMLELLLWKKCHFTSWQDASIRIFEFRTRFSTGVQGTDWASNSHLSQIETTRFNVDQCTILDRINQLHWPVDENWMPTSFSDLRTMEIFKMKFHPGIYLLPCTSPSASNQSNYIRERNWYNYNVSWANLISKFCYL